jgi:hypothetical protein
MTSPFDDRWQERDRRMFDVAGEQWIKAFGPQIPPLMARARDLGFNFVPGQRPRPGKGGHIPTTMEWSRKLTANDIAVLKGEAPYSEKVPDVEEGFTQADPKDPQKSQAITKVIESRLAKCRQDRPIGYLVCEAPAEDVRSLQQLAGHVREGGFITKFRKTFRDSGPHVRGCWVLDLALGKE